MARTDKTMLQALLDFDNRDKLTEMEQDAFRDMNDRLDSSRDLSPKQHDWVERVFLKLNLDAEEPAENWVSSGKVQSVSSGKVFDFERQAKPLRPPGRK